MTNFTKEQLIAYLQDELNLLREVSAKLPRTTALKMDIVIHEAALAALTSAPRGPKEWKLEAAQQFDEQYQPPSTEEAALFAWNACRAVMHGATISNFADFAIDEGSQAAAPPAPVVPEEMPAGLAGQIVSLCAFNIRDKELAQKIWNACRAAIITTTSGKEG